MKRPAFPKSDDQHSLIDAHREAQESHLLQCAKLAGLNIPPAAVRALASAAHHATLMHFSKARVYFKQAELLRIRDVQIFRETNADEIQTVAIAAGLSGRRIYQVINRERRTVRR